MMEHSQRGLLVPLIQSERDGLDDVSIEERALSQESIENKVMSVEHYRAIIALSCGAFVLRVNEFIPLNFLTEIADAFSLSVATTAASIFSLMLVSSLGLSRAMLWTAHVERNYLLVTLQMLLAVSAVLCAVSPQFPVLLLGRLFSSVSHVTYMGTAAMTVVSMVPASQKDQANSLFFMGAALGSIIGVPLNVYWGEQTQWRNIFWPVTFLSLCASMGIMIFLPKNDAQTPITAEDLAIFKKVAVWRALSASTLAYAGMVISHTFFAKIMVELAGYKQSDLLWLTILYGMGGVLGTLWGDNLYHVRVLKCVTSQLTALTIVLFGFTVAVDYKILAAITLFASGFTGFAMVTPLMRYIADKAVKGMPLAESANSFVFEIGSALGIFASFLAIQQGCDYRFLNTIGGFFVFMGLSCILYEEKKLCRPKNKSCCFFSRPIPGSISVYDLQEKLEDPRSVRISDDQSSMDGASEHGGSSRRSSFSASIFKSFWAQEDPVDHGSPGRLSFSELLRTNVNPMPPPVFVVGTDTTECSV